MQGGSISVNAVAVAIVDALATCHHTTLATVYEPAMCHRGPATVQVRAICYSQKLSRAESILDALCTLQVSTPAVEQTSCCRADAVYV